MGDITISTRPCGQCNGTGIRPSDEMVEAVQRAIERGKLDSDGIRALVQEMYAQAAASPLIIENLRAENARMREALEPFARVVHAYDYWIPDVLPALRFPVEGADKKHDREDCPESVCELSEGDFRRARAALQPPAQHRDDCCPALPTLEPVDAGLSGKGEQPS